MFFVARRECTSRRESTFEDSQSHVAFVIVLHHYGHANVPILFLCKGVHCCMFLSCTRHGEKPASDAVEKKAERRVISYKGEKEASRTFLVLELCLL